jgi:hypothetical protein
MFLLVVRTAPQHNNTPTTHIRHHLACKTSDVCLVAQLALQQRYHQHDLALRVIFPMSHSTPFILLLVKINIAHTRMPSNLHVGNHGVFWLVFTIGFFVRLQLETTNFVSHLTF